MCGIAGFVDSEGSVAHPERVVRRMLDRMVARGPDGSGQKRLAPAYLGHRRLSIIDLETGQQPMSTEEGRYWLTYNGEVYNYRELREDLRSQGCQFRTSSDSEVILHLYAAHGPAMLEKLEHGHELLTVPAGKVARIRS